jgi:ribosomal small subunit protein bTHX
MGKGDKKTKRGKIVNRSYGVRRKKNVKAPTRATVHQTAPVTEEKVKVVKTVKPRTHKEPEAEKELKTTVETKEPKTTKEHKEHKEPKEAKSPKKKNE